MHTSSFFATVSELLHIESPKDNKVSEPRCVERHQQRLLEQCLDERGPGSGAGHASLKHNKPTRTCCPTNDQTINVERNDEEKALGPVN